MISMRGLMLVLGFSTTRAGVGSPPPSPDPITGSSGITTMRGEGVVDRDTGMSGCKSKGGGGKSVAISNWKEGVELGVDPMDRVVLAEGVIDVDSEKEELSAADWDGCTVEALLGD